jgi:hypothetical protein
VLRVKYAAYEGHWALVEQKAQKWLKKNLPSVGPSFDWVSFAVQLARNVLRD